jgi:hypothetical protein
MTRLINGAIQRKQIIYSKDNDYIIDVGPLCHAHLGARQPSTLPVQIPSGSNLF